MIEKLAEITLLEWFVLAVYFAIIPFTMFVRLNKASSKSRFLVKFTKVIVLFGVLMVVILTSLFVLLIPGHVYWYLALWFGNLAMLAIIMKGLELLRLGKSEIEDS